MATTVMGKSAVTLWYGNMHFAAQHASCTHIGAVIWAGTLLKAR